MEEYKVHECSEDNENGLFIYTNTHVNKYKLQKEEKDYDLDCED